MKAISLWQPWASLVIVGAKQYETRSWKTSYRGTLVIHAALKWDRELETLAIVYMGMADMDRSQKVFLGAALGTVELLGCFRTEDVLGYDVPEESLETEFGDFSPGRWAWKLANPVAFPEPIACTGHQRLWDVGSECVTGFPNRLAAVV